MKKIGLTILMLAVASTSAFAAVQNLKVSGSVRSTFIHRENFDLGKAPTGDEIQDIFITNTHLRLDADLTDKVSATIDLLNERAWGNDTASAGLETGVKINLAYVTLREMLYSPLTIVVGRQLLRYGNQFVLGESKEPVFPPGSSNLSFVAFDQSDVESFDAVKFILDYQPLTIDIFYAKIDSNTVAGASEDDDDIDFYGIYSVYDFENVAKTKIDAYFLAKIDKYVANNASPAPATGIKPDTIYMPGFRVSSGLAEGLWTSLEVVWERGNKVLNSATPAENQRREAFATQLLTFYQLPVLKDYKPALIHEFTYTTGDSNKTDTAYSGEVSRNVFTAWDRLYEDQDNGSILNTIVSLSNAVAHTVAFQFYPVEELKTVIAWTGLWTNTPIYSASEIIAQPDGFNVVTLTPGQREIGYEIDLFMYYQYTEDVEFNLSLGWVILGDAVNDTANPNGPFQVLAGTKVNF
ncbi:MAG: alginate export family protein [Candidatus Omnitrophica bacterium]|nr:alginate export family protein [Candidatus Omnitrophota bacterium]